MRHAATSLSGGRFSTELRDHPRCIADLQQGLAEVEHNARNNRVLSLTQFSV